MDSNQIVRTVKTLRELAREYECSEFKQNNFNAEETGEYISAIANSAALMKEPSGFIIWGVDDVAHQIVGTTFKPHKEKVGNEELENWLSHHLTPRVDFKIHEVQVEGKPVVVFEIPATRHTPVRFKDVEFIRVGSYKKKLKDFPEKESVLWKLLVEYSFERDMAMTDVSGSEVLDLIDYQAYFELTKQPPPENDDAILQRLIDEKVIAQPLHNGYDITNFGAILFARDVRNFDRLSRKALRVIIYKGKNRVETKREKPGLKGYAAGFAGAIRYINSQLPTNEHVGEALREEVPMYPPIAIRELVANALIHQDFSIAGAGPVVEIFDDRIEITNPGKPLIETLRFIDQPPRSRNEDLAAFMRRINICEERGSGIDKVVSAVEAFQLPPPDFRASEDNTIAVLFSDRPLSQMTNEERIRACYQHACLQYVSNDRMTNSSLRKRFAIEEKNYSIASRIIADTIKAQMVKLFDPESSSKKHARYVPIWA
ncbi:MAG TPA: ATP-binding protein [Pyrinomonadaceae bacterium]